MLFTLFAVILGQLVVSGSTACADESAEIEFFERKIRPLLVQHCYECHSKDSKTVQGNLRLDHRDGLLNGGDSGPAVVPGKPDESLLVEAVRYDPNSYQMPPDGKLSDTEVELLVTWVRRGGVFPGTDEDLASTQPASIDWNEARQFWSFRPLADIEAPVVANTAWPQRRVDQFILHRLESKGLTPSAPADRRTLIRRLSFDLTGLPPTPEQVERFVQDTSPEAYEHLVDDLLSSPHYGERWARYWLDLVRYTDTTASWLQSTGQAWLYRDWVVRALNEDLPYDEFVRLQLAADLIGAAPEHHAALGFLGLSPTYWKELRLDKEVIKQVVASEWEERIDMVSRSLLGLTVACARCHDHKFDPITTEDYYGLAGVFASTRLTDRWMLPESEAQQVEAARKAVAKLEEQIASLRKTAKEQKKTGAGDGAGDDSAKAPEAAASTDSAADAPLDPAEQIAGLESEIQRIKQSTPHFDAPQVHAVSDSSLYVLANGPDQTRLEYRDEPRDVAVQIRGNPSKPGQVVPRRFLELFAASEPRLLQTGSGRGELAEAIFRDAQSLAARVIVNRVWMHHFGEALVTTPSNFGKQGELPSHPLLLDDLARRFVANGWSLKWLHREILLSATYQQSSLGREECEQVDPGNRLLWRMHRRRLDIESWRDAMLFVSGQLDTTLGGSPEELESAANVRRTIYGRVHRRDLNRMLRLHDFPDPTAHSPKRAPTTTPLQQLFALNSSFVRKQSEALVRAASSDGSSPVATATRMYRILFGREPDNEEREWATTFLQADKAQGDAQDKALETAVTLDPSTRERLTLFAQALLCSNEFMFVD